MKYSIVTVLGWQAGTTQSTVSARRLVDYAVLIIDIKYDINTRLIYPDKILFKIAEEIVNALGRHQTVILPMGDATNAYKIAIAGIPSNQNVTMECALKVWLISNLVAPFSHLPCILDFFYICRRFLWWFFQRWQIINI